MIEPQAIKDNLARMKRNRSSYDTAWGEIAKLVYPALQNHFGSMGRGASFMRNQAPTDAAHDPYTTLALADGVSVFESYVMPRGQRWQQFTLGDEALMADVENQRWLDTFSLRLFTLRNDPRSGFAAAMHLSAVSSFAFGPQSLWVDERWENGRWAGISYQSEFIGDIYVERDASGNVMRIYREFQLTAEQAYRKWGESSPAIVRKAMEQTKPQVEAEFTFVHLIEPNGKFDPERGDYRGKPWHSGYYCCDDDASGLFVAGGYRTLPRIFSSFDGSAQATYGCSPTMIVLPYVRQSQQMMIDRTLGAELRLLPPLLTADDMLDNAVLELRALGVTEGGLDDRGNPLVREFLSNADASDAKELTAELRQMIDQVYYRHLLQVNREYKTHIPAARIEEERAEKGLLLGPLQRMEQEWLDPMTQREISIMDERGLADDMPDAIAEYLGDGGVLNIRYDNGLTALQEASKSAAFLSFAGQVSALAQADPTYVEDFKREYPSHRVLPELGRIAGVPAAMRASEEERAEYDQRKLEQQQLQQLLDAAPALAGAAKDMQQMPPGGVM